MECPVCAIPMVEVSTEQGAWIWACSSRHGLLVHVLDLWRFVENYAAYYQALEKAERTRGSLISIECPDCLSPLQSFPLGCLRILTCSKCNWKWLPEGTLTTVHRLYAKTNEPTFDEESVYEESRQPPSPFGMRVDRTRRDLLETPSVILTPVVLLIIGIFAVMADTKSYEFLLLAVALTLSIALRKYRN